MKRYVIAIGGNALEENRKDLDCIFASMAETLARLIQRGNQIVLVFGNGPQVGKLVMQNHYASDKLEENSIDECVAMTQALIGYQLEKELGNALGKYNADCKLVNVITQVEVDSRDVLTAPATKPIGPAYTKEEAEHLCAVQPGITFKEDPGRGYRRVVISPQPKSIIEIDTIKALMDQEHIVIAGGGGGIPVVKEKDCNYCGVAAVIDKDLTAEKIAEEIDADVLILLTGTEYVLLHYQKKDETRLERVSCGDMLSYMDAGEFPEGSMLPKVKAAVKFVKSKSSREAVIGTIGKLSEIVEEASGTRIFL